MFRNVWYDKQNCTINLWHEKNGERLFEKVDWTPYVFIPTDKQTGIKTIFGDNVLRKKFKNYWEYKKYQEEHDDIFENNMLPEIQYLVERYHSIKDEDIKTPKLKKFVIDIETISEEGFPEPEEAKWPINLISLYDIDTNEIFTFGEQPYTKTTLENENVQYYHAQDEQDLLQTFIDFFRNSGVDVVTGWNISYNKKTNTSGFDFPYIINRIKKIFEEKDKYKELSPIGEVTYRKNQDGEYTTKIHGITIIDYLSAYKWYSRDKLESYKLDEVCKVELKKKKLDYSEYGNLNNLYKQNWNLFVDYNIIDVKRVKEINDKRQFIELVQTMSLITKCPMESYQSMTALLEGKMLVHLRNNGLCAPRMYMNSREHYPAAYVKEPQLGLHKWLTAIDIKSSYPTAIVTLNMSLETYVGKITSFEEDKVIEYTSNREFPEFEMLNSTNGNKTSFKGKQLDNFNLMLKKGLLCIAPNGVVFKTGPEGVISQVEREMFIMRQMFKKKMYTTDDKNIKLKWDTTQNSLKTLINSFYGILAYPQNNRYFLVDLASAITACARHTVRQGERFVNELLNNPEKSDKLIGILNILRSL